MSHSLVAADRMTHIKIVVVALAVGTVVMMAAVHAHSIKPETQFGRTQVDSPLGKANDPQDFSHRRTQARKLI